MTIHIQSNDRKNIAYFKCVTFKIYWSDINNNIFVLRNLFAEKENLRKVTRLLNIMLLLIGDTRNTT